MNHSFVDQCLREWRRIGVPDAIANEMAADLRADLDEAAADGVAPEEVLGNGVFDAPSFARSWAAARGVIPPAPAPILRHDAQRGLAVVLAAMALVGTGLLALAIVHPTARSMAVRAVAFHGPASGRRLVLRPAGVLVQHSTGIGAPPGLLLLGLLMICALAGGAWMAWRHA